MHAAQQQRVDGAAGPQRRAMTTQVRTIVVPLEASALAPALPCSVAFWCASCGAARGGAQFPATRCLRTSQRKRMSLENAMTRRNF